MKPGINYIDREKLLAVIASKPGLVHEEKKGWDKFAAPSGRRVYLPKTKKVGRVDLASVDFPGEGVVNLGGQSMGSVTQQLDLSVTEDQALANFAKVLDHMLAAPAIEKKTSPRAAKGGSQPAEGQTAEGKVQEPAADPQEKRLKHLRLVAKTAAKRDLQMNDELAAELKQLEDEIGAKFPNPDAPATQPTA